MYRVLISIILTISLICTFTSLVKKFKPDEPAEEIISMNVEAKNLEECMQNIFDGNLVKNETVMFLEKGEARDMLFSIDEILSVTSYDGNTVYTEGVDYELKNGQIVCLEGGSIPCITKEVFYNDEDSIIKINRNGKTVPLYWGEGTTMTQWQVNITYTHTDKWNGYKQECAADTLKPFLEKLVNGEDVTVIFYGDSITFGANASAIIGTQPGQMPYTILFTKALADLFGYNVRYINTNLPSTAKVPADYDTGSSHTITYINPSVGGWSSVNGLDNYDEYIKPFIKKYGCDLFVLAFGMNDGGTSPAKIYRTEKKILNKVKSQSSDVNLLIMATMVPNPDGIGWYGSQPEQEKKFIDGAAKYAKRGTPCAVVCMGSTSLSVLEHKQFRDYTGNNINHPNDFFSRVYAQTMLQCVVGYENLK